MEGGEEFTRAAFSYSPTNATPPIIDPPYQKTFEWEKFDLNSWTAWMGQHRYLGIYIGIVYVSVIFSLKRWMKNREAFELRGPLIAWNVGHALFSAAAISRCFYPFYQALMSESGGLHQSICSRDGRTMTEEFWIFLAAWSRVVEMGDTIFVVLRKSPLIFLHWYHHLSVVIICFYAFDWMDPIRRWYICMNLTIHAFMYTYYALKVAGVKVPRILAMSLTTIQILQMITGVSLGGYSAYAIYQGWPCERRLDLLIIEHCVGVSFFFLFSKYFIDAYFKNVKRRAAKGKKTM